MAKYLNTDGLTHLVELIKNGMAPKEHKHSYDDMVEDTAPVAKQITGETINSDLINRHGSIGEMTVFGRTRQNLWANPSGTEYGITSTSNEDGTLTLSGTCTATAYVAILVKYVYNVKPNTTYTASIDKTFKNDGNTAENYIRLFLAFGSSDNVWNKQDGFGPGSRTSFQFTTTSTTNQLVFGLQAYGNPSGVSVSGTYRVMLREATEEEIAAAQQTASTLQEGGTADLPQDHPVTLPADPSVYATNDDFDWCPPGINGTEPTAIVTAGKNLIRLDPMLKAKTVNGITYTPNEDGTISVSGTSTKTADYYLYGKSWKIGDENFLKGIDRPVTISGSSENCSVILYAMSADGNTLVPVSSTLSNPSQTIEADSEFFDLEKAFCYLSIRKGITIDTVVNPQLELGSTATAYEPPAITSTTIDMHGHALYSLPDGTRDELQVDGTGKMSISNGILAISFDGSENWTKSGQAQAGHVFYVQYERKFNRDHAASILCDSMQTAVYSSDNDLENANEWSVGLYTGGATSFDYIGVRSGNDITSVDGLKSWIASHPFKVFAPLMEAKTIELGRVELPSVKSDKVNVWIDANLPTQLEATIIDLPILPIASGGTGADNTEEARSNLDVYSKAEVDSKLDNIEIDEVVPISKGGTGKITAKAAQNALLASMNELTTDATDNASFVMRYDVPDDTKGAVFVRKASHVWNYIASKIRSTFGFSSSNVLPISHGGTGATTAKAAQNALLGDMNSRNSDNINDDSYFVMAYDSPSSSVGAVYKRTGANIWNWISSKIRSAFGFNDSNILKISNGGTNATSAAGALKNLGITATAAELNKLDGVTATSTELNYVDGVTSNIQTQLNGKAASSHKHSAADITSGTLPITRGGTGLTTSPSMLVNLASTAADTVLEASPRPGVTGTLSVAHGGTGATTAADALSNLGITISTSEAPATGTPGTIHIQML